MKAALHRLAVSAGFAAVVALLPQAAYAEATLEAQVVGATCTVTTSGGTTTAVACSADSWVVALQPGWSAQMVATIDYTYADDGLPLASPGFITTASGGGGVETVFYEAGALYAATSFCLEGCDNGRYWESWTGSNGFPPVFVSDNQIADSLSGTLTVTTGAHNISTTSDIFNPPVTWSPNVYIAIGSGPVAPLTFSGIEPVGAIPEPSTFALMLLGLGALGATAVRRSRRAVSR